MECAKCKAKADGSRIVEGGIMYPFCSYCYEKIASAPKNNSHLQDYLSMTKKEWIDRNMKLAKEARERGEIRWSKKN